MTARATHDQTPVSVTSGSKREASEMRNDPNTSSTPPHPVEEAVALTPERIDELRKIAEGAGGVAWEVWSSLYEGMGAAVVHNAEPLETIAEVRKFARAVHIATFNPAFVLALLSALERQREALEGGSGPDGPSGLASGGKPPLDKPEGAA